MRPPQTNGRSARLVAVVPLALFTLLAPRPARPATGAPEPDTAKLQTAESDLRNVGTGMWRWYKAEQKPRRQKAELSAPPAVEDVTKVPVISYADLEKLLVPKYLKELPQNDPWGHAYDFRLSQDPEADEVMVVRSAGADGEFSGNVYKVGAFSPNDPAEDLVWKDGYFVRWPKPHDK